MDCIDYGVAKSQTQLSNLQNSSELGESFRESLSVSFRESLSVSSLLALSMLYPFYVFTASWLTVDLVFLS